MGFYDAFFGSEQSQYTAYAIFAAIIAICITILLTATDVPVSNRLLIVFFVIISLVPSVFLTLFELTCIVTGGTEPNKWWCYAFAWILAAFIIIYCIFIVIISLISLFTYNNAIDNIKENEDKSRISQEASNNYAKQIIENDDIHTKQIEKFYNDQMSMDMSINDISANKKPETKVFNPADSMNSIANNIQPDQFEMPQNTVSHPSPPPPPSSPPPSSPPPSSQSFPSKPHNTSSFKNKEIASFENIATKSPFSNYGDNETEEFGNDAYFPYDKFSAN